MNAKIIFITGATGMSRAAAVEVARRGARVAMLSRTLEEVEETIREVEDTGSEGLALEGDISEEGDLRNAYVRIIERWGRLDGVFANAGVNGKWAPLEELEADEWRKTLDINLTGTFFTVKHAVPHLRAQGGGAIVITSSVNGTRMFSNSGASAYAASKAGQLAFAQMVALELAPAGIRINVICPGAIDTEIEENTEREDLETICYPREFPKGKLPLTHGEPGKATDVAKAVAFLLSDDAAFITGTPLWIDGAQSLFMG